MLSTQLSSKGQVIIPKALRDAHHWHSGTRLAVLDTADGIVLKPLQASEKTPITPGLAAIRKRIAYAGTPKTLQEMNAAVQQLAALQK